MFPKNIMDSHTLIVLVGFIFIFNSDISNIFFKHQNVVSQKSRFRKSMFINFFLVLCAFAFCTLGLGSSFNLDNR